MTKQTDKNKTDFNIKNKLYNMDDIKVKLKIEKVQMKTAKYQICTDGSNMNDKVGSTFFLNMPIKMIACVFTNRTFRHEIKICINPNKCGNACVIKFHMYFS